MSATPATPEQHEFPARGRGRMWLRFLLAAVVVVVMTAGVTATGALLEVQGFVNDLKKGGTIAGLGHVVTPADAGEPQTILLIGSDHRASDASTNARSDTMILVRLDPHTKTITVLSIPRDLKIDYTYKNVLYSGRKINETYTVGGEALTAKVIKRLLGGIDINHVVNIDFKGFKAAVDAIGCVYVDVDRHYEHTNLPGGEQYAEIHISAGYQRLCGSQALDYVRFRHLDTDFVRAARQQDFLRQAKGQYGIGRFLGDPHLVTGPIGRHMHTDKNLQSKEELLRLVNLLAYTIGSPIRQVQFPPAYDNSATGSYVTANAEVLATLRQQFLAEVPLPAPHPPQPAGHGGKKRPPGAGKASAGDLVNAAATGENYAIQLGPMRIPIYYPKLLTPRGTYATLETGENPRAYRIRDKDHKPHAAYRLVVNANDPSSPGNYYGIEGTTWLDPPILANPSDDSRVVNGKKLELFYDGKLLRTVAWPTPKAVYWVQNTLQEKLTNHQMLAIAGSLTRLGR